MTVLDIENYVASLVDDLNFDYFTKPQLLRFINQAAQQTQQKLVLAGNNWYVKLDVSVPTVINQTNYALPTDFLKMNRLESVLNISTVNEQWYTLNSVTLNQKDMNYIDTESSCFYFLKNTLYLQPPPQTVRTLRMYYTYRIADVVLDADIPDVPPEYHEYIANLVAQRCFLKDGRDPGFILTQLKEVEDNLAASAIERAQDHASTVVIIAEDYSGY